MYILSILLLLLFLLLSIIEKQAIQRTFIIDNRLYAARQYMVRQRIILLLIGIQILDIIISETAPHILSLKVLGQLAFLAHRIPALQLANFAQSTNLNHRAVQRKPLNLRAANFAVFRYRIFAAFVIAMIDAIQVTSFAFMQLHQSRHEPLRRKLISEFAVRPLTQTRFTQKLDIFVLILCAFDRHMFITVRIATVCAHILLARLQLFELLLFASTACMTWTIPTVFLRHLGQSGTMNVPHFHAIFDVANQQISAVAASKTVIFIVVLRLIAVRLQVIEFYVFHALRHVTHRHASIVLI
mmetsp:Transcript_21071/g.33658  ORF Transcript_21071/g.33658 Transcript_21071/m.33658 type:complete len:299 (+) Transcript_21071:228-1124(+)